MSNEDNAVSTSTGDDADFNAGQQPQNFDDIPVPMGPMAKHLGIDDDLPEDSVEVDPEDSVDEVPTEDDTEEDDTLDQEDNTLDDEDGIEDDEESTQDSDLLTEEDIDWDYKVPVKIDGVEEHLTLEELRKGYATDQSLSKKGNKIGEQRKEFENEQNSKLQDLQGMASVLQEQLQGEENELAAEYHSFDDKIKEARKEGNTYEITELKDQRETAQEAYWNARQKREGLAQAVQEKQQQQFDLQQQELSVKFNADIETLVPTFHEDAEAIQQFALDEGIPPQLLPLISDATVIKFIDDYRKLKQKATKGAVKRKATPKAKSAPVKKGMTRNAQQVKANTAVRNKVLTGEGTEDDQLSFLKNLSKFS
jgi:hypothetical protein